MIEGPGRSGVLLVAEEMDSAEKKLLRGPGGFYMGRAFSRGRCEWRIGPFGPQQYTAGTWGREEFAYATPDEAPEAEVTVAFGTRAFQALTGLDLDAGAVRGYVFPRSGGGWIIPTFHPTWLSKGNQYLQMAFLWDVDKAREIARDGFAYETLECLADPPLGAWQDYVAVLVTHIEAGGTFATDIETLYKRGKKEDEVAAEEDPTFTILDISFAFEAGRGVTVPFQQPYLAGVQAIFEAHAASAESICVIHNRSYDQPRIRRNCGAHLLPMRRTEDALWAWHTLYNHLDRGLGFVTSCFPLGQGRLPAWKHLGQDDPYYRIADSVALWRNYRDTMALLRATGQDAVYNLFMPRLDPHLERMSASGLLLDREMRGRVSIELGIRQAAMQAAITAVVPPELLPRHTWKSKAKAEKGIALLRAADELLPGVELEAREVFAPAQTCGACGAWPVTKAHTTRRFLKQEAQDDATGSVGAASGSIDGGETSNSAGACEV